MKKMISFDKLEDAINACLFEAPFGEEPLIEVYKNYVRWIDNTPDDIFTVNYADRLPEVNDKEKFQEEMMIRLDCKWGEKLVNKMKEYLYNDMMED